MTTLQYEDSGYREKQIQKEKDEFAIGFAEWLGENEFTMFSNGNWHSGLGRACSTTELLEIYKKEKI